MLQTLKTLVDPFGIYGYNSCGVNLYPDGKKGLKDHSDNEPDILGHVISTVSVGATRQMIFRAKYTQGSETVSLDHGSLLEMQEDCQDLLTHAIAKSEDIKEPRISFTFRKLKKEEKASKSTEEVLLALKRDFEEYKRKKELELSKIRQELARLRLSIKGPKGPKGPKEPRFEYRVVQSSAEQRQPQSSFRRQDSQDDKYDRPTDVKDSKKNQQTRTDTNMQEKVPGIVTDDKSHERSFVRNPRVLFVKGVVDGRATASPEWIMKFFSTSGIFPSRSVEKVTMVGPKTAHVIKLLMRSEADALSVLRSKPKLRLMPSFKNVFIDIQRSYQERAASYLKRKGRNTVPAQFQSSSVTMPPWSGANAIPRAQPRHSSIPNSAAVGHQPVIGDQMYPTYPVAPMHPVVPMNPYGGPVGSPQYDYLNFQGPARMGMRYY